MPQIPTSFAKMFCMWNILQNKVRQEKGTWKIKKYVHLNSETRKDEIQNR